MLCYQPGQIENKHRKVFKYNIIFRSTVFTQSEKIKFSFVRTPLETEFKLDEYESNEYGII